MIDPQENATPPEMGTVLEEAQAGEIMRLVEQLEQAQAKLADKEQQYTRLYADFDNFRRRTQREKEELKLTAANDTLLALLPILDNFDRARLQIRPEQEREVTIHNSYQAVYKQFFAVLEKLGVVQIPALDEPFDPKLHEAIMQEDSPTHTKETVIAEFQKGYYLGDRVLRHALVKVATPVPGGPVIPESPLEPELTPDDAS